MVEKKNVGIPPLAIEHDNRHLLDKTEFARESLAYIIQVPEKNIGGFLYTWVNGEHKAGAAVSLFGSGIGEEPIFEVCDGLPVSPEKDFYDWQVGPLKLTLNEPLKTAHLLYSSDKVTVDYHFKANHAAYAYSSHTNGCPQWMAQDRFEQQGFAQGYITVNDKRVDFKGFGLRDHSWGTRDWGVNQHWKWVHAQAGPDVGLHFWSMFALGKSHLCGFVNRNGNMAQIVDVEIDFSCSEGLRPKKLNAKVLDSSGQSMTLVGETYGSFPFKVHDLITLFECPMNLTIDGVSGSGWVEMAWPNDLINYMQDRTV